MNQKTELLKYMKQKVIELKEETDNFERLSTSLSQQSIKLLDRKSGRI